MCVMCLLLLWVGEPTLHKSRMYGKDAKKHGRAGRGSVSWMVKEEKVRWDGHTYIRLMSVLTVVYSYRWMYERHMMKMIVIQ